MDVQIDHVIEQLSLTIIPAAAASSCTVSSEYQMEICNCASLNYILHIIIDINQCTRYRHTKNELSMYDVKT